MVKAHVTSSASPSLITHLDVEKVGELALTVAHRAAVLLVCREVVPLHAVGVAERRLTERRHVDDAARRRLQQMRHQQLGQMEMADVIHAELRLETVLGLAARRVGNAGVVDEEMQRHAARGKGVGEAADRGEAAELDRHGDKLAGRDALEEARDRRLTQRKRARSGDDGHAGAREGGGGLKADARGCASDDGDAAGLILAIGGRNVRGGRLGAEARGAGDAKVRLDKVLGVKPGGEHR